MQRYVTASELAGLPGLPKTPVAVRAVLARLQVAGRERVGRGGGMEYPLDALPLAVRAALSANDAAVPTAGGALRATALVQHTGIAAQRHTLARLAGAAAAANVTGWQRRERDARMRVLVAFQKYWKGFGGALCPALEAFICAWRAGQIACDDDTLARFKNLSFSTLRAWYVALQQQGVAAITPAASIRRGQYAALEGDVGRVLVALLTDMPHLSAAQIHRMLQDQGIDELPSSRAVQRAVAYWKSANRQVYAALTNPDAWKSKYLSAAGSRSEQVRAPNDLWEMDSTKGDVMCSDGQRHAVIGVIDVYTRRTMFLVSRQSRAGAIMALIRKAILAWGLPKQIKTDNGADYTAEQLEFALLGLIGKDNHLLCDPFQPQQKPHIERHIGTLMHDLFELLPGYIGHNVADRKAIEARRSFAQRLTQGEDGGVVDMRVAPEQLQSWIDSWCERYHERAHGGLNGHSPNARLAAWRGSLLTVDERALDMLLASADAHGLRTVTKKGIRLDRGTFNCAQLGGLEGKQVQVKTDEADLGRCYVFDLDGNYVGTALDYERLGISSAEVANERRARQAKMVREQKAQLRLASKEVNTPALVAAVLDNRRSQAMEASPNVVTLPKPRVQTSTPAIDSIVAAHAPQIDEAALNAAQNRLADRLNVKAAVASIDTPEVRYARWLRLERRVAAGDALTATERNWFEAYPAASEHGAMARLFTNFGLDADEVLQDAGG